jgi:hypothetical protein
MMKIEQQIDHIIQDALPAITGGNETLESVVAKHSEIAEELRPRLEAAIWLQQASFALSTRPGYIHDSRKYLEAKIKSLQPTGFWQRLFMRYQPSRWVFNIASPIVLFLLLAMVINSAVLTAKLSIPGDPFYGTKLFIEDMRLAITFDQVSKTVLYIDYSRERTTEFVNLVLEGDYEHLPGAANRMETEIIASLRSLEDIPTGNAAMEYSMVANLRDTLSNEVSMLNVLKKTSPPSALPGIELAINVAQSGLMALR